MTESVSEILSRDGATLEHSDGPHVHFACRCGTSHHKTTRALRQSGAFCAACTQRKTAIKRLKRKIAENEALLQRLE